MATTEKSIFIAAVTDVTKATVGDQIHYKIMVTHRPGIKLLNQPELKTGDFKILAKTVLPPVEKKGYVMEGKAYTLTAFTTGPHTIEPVKVEYLDAQGNKGVVESNEVPITIQSVLSNADVRSDIRDVKGVQGIPPQYQKYIPFIWGTLGALVLIILFLIFRKKLAKHFSKVDYLLNPYDEALKKLNELARSLPKREEKIKPFYLELSHAIRHYLERNFGISTEELTTHELTEQLKGLPLLPEVQAKLVDFFEACDLVKFAQFLPLPDEILKDVDRGKAVVELSNPKPAPTGPAAV